MTGDPVAVVTSEMDGRAAEALARLNEVTRADALVLVRRDDVVAVLAVLARVADELDVLRQMGSRSAGGRS